MKTNVTILYCTCMIFLFCRERRVVGRRERSVNVLVI